MVVNQNDTLYFENSKFFHRSEDRFDPNLSDCVREMFHYLP